jgi:hypothetical protein
MMGKQTEYCMLLVGLVLLCCHLPYGSASGFLPNREQELGLQTCAFDFSSLDRPLLVVTWLNHQVHPIFGFG